jgi:histidinol-phosphate aminotransferase
MIHEIDKVRLPYNINILTQISAEFALKHKDVLDSQTDQIKLDRAKLFEALNSIDGIEVFPSQANFFLFRLTNASSDEVFDKLKAQKVLIKNMSHAAASLKNCLRVTVGLPVENETFLSALQSALK